MGCSDVVMRYVLCVSYCDISWRKKLEQNETVHQLFIDVKKAYDSVRREVLYNGVWGTHEISQADKNVFNETCCKVRIGKHLSDNFPIQNGLK
jgi:hypothetical protein